jgi:S1-C subfamily serine protease
MDRLITYGKVTRGYLGINIQALTPELAKEFKLPDESSGVLVGGITPNSAAARAGLREGDVITEFNGKKVTDPASLQLAVAEPAKRPLRRRLTNCRRTSLPATATVHGAKAASKTWMRLMGWK